MIDESWEKCCALPFRFADDWSLLDAASGLAIARIHAEPDGGWRCVCRSIVEGELKDSIITWFKTGKEAKDYAEAQTGGQLYVVESKRTKTEILRRAGNQGISEPGQLKL